MTYIPTGFEAGTLLTLGERAYDVYKIEHGGKSGPWHLQTKDEQRIWGDVALNVAESLTRDDLELLMKRRCNHQPYPAAKDEDADPQTTRLEETIEHVSDLVEHGEQMLTKTQSHLDQRRDELTRLRRIRGDNDVDPGKLGT